jgi:hypothetical protein
VTDHYHTAAEGPDASTIPNDSMKICLAIPANFFWPELQRSGRADIV